MDHKIGITAIVSRAHKRQEHFIESSDSRPARVTALSLAGLSIVVWFVTIVSLRPHKMVDENTHYPVVEQLTRGHWPWQGQIPMLPTAHLLTAAVVKLTGPSLTAARAVSAALSLGAVFVFFAAARHRHGESAGAHTLLMIWNPLFFPYCVQVYTEPASMLAVVTGLYFHVRRKTLLAAGALLFACLIRQSNIVWVALMVAWLMVEQVQGKPVHEIAGWLGRMRRAARQWLPRAWPELAVLALFVGVFALRPARFLAPTADNRAGFNRAQYYLFFIAAAIVFLPLWVAALRRNWDAILVPRLARAGVCALAVAAIGALVMLYDNPHHWNGNPNFLHDRFLVLLYTSLAARYIASTLIVIAGVGLWLMIRQSPRPVMLGAAWIFALVFLAPHRLVDHRYYIFPLLFIHFFSTYTPRQHRQLCVWNFMLSAAAATYTIAYGGPESGL